MKQGHAVQVCFPWRLGRRGQWRRIGYKLNLLRDWCSRLSRRRQDVGVSQPNISLSVCTSSCKQWHAQDSCGKVGNCTLLRLQEYLCLVEGCSVGRVGSTAKINAPLQTIKRRAVASLLVASGSASLVQSHLEASATTRATPRLVKHCKDSCILLSKMLRRLQLQN